MVLIIVLNIISSKEIHLVFLKLKLFSYLRVFWVDGMRFLHATTIVVLVELTMRLDFLRFGRNDRGVEMTVG